MLLESAQLHLFDFKPDFWRSIHYPWPWFFSLSSLVGKFNMIQTVGL